MKMEQEVKDRFDNKVPDFYIGYFNESGTDDIIETLKHHQKDTCNFILNIPHDKADFAYAENKWSVKEVIIHIIDVERLFSARALQFARNDKTPVPGFDENEYIPFSNARNRSIQSLLDEYQAVRESTIQQFLNFTDEMKRRSGIANNVRISVETIGRTLAGHEIHHKKIIKERYLQQ